MSKFRKKETKETPAISTASLPDIIFILLFFFMVATVIKDSELLVKVKIPAATELQKLQKKSLVSNIYIGAPTKKFAAKFGTAPRIQLDDQFADKEDIRLFLELQRAGKSPKKIRRMTTSLEVDEEVTMGIVSDVKVELRKNDARKINYSAVGRSKDL